MRRKDILSVAFGSRSLNGNYPTLFLKRITSVLSYFRGVKNLSLILVFVVLSMASLAQKNISDTTIRFFAISGQLGFQSPAGMLASRFGPGGLVGGTFLYKSVRNFTVEAGVGFLFSGIVHEDSILDPLKTEAGNFIGRDGNPVDVFLSQRGFVSTIKVGKIIPVMGPNDNSGIHLALGGGVMQHKIRIKEEFEDLPQLAGDYRKGYDRLSNGWCLTQSIGYQHFGNYRFVNFYLGLEMFEGFTQNRRTINFDTKEHDNTQRLDLISTIVLKWYFPMYKRKPSEYYFY